MAGGGGRAGDIVRAKHVLMVAAVISMLLWLIIQASEAQAHVEAKLPPTSCSSAPEGSAAYPYSCSSAAAASSPTSSKKKSYPPTLTYYVQAQENQSAYVVAPVNEAVSGTFGQLAAFAYFLTKEEAVNSTQLGTIRGLEVYNSVDINNQIILVLNTVTYDDGVYNGTLSLHGQGNIVDTNYELTVVGGTGSFRGVHGYAAITNLRTSGTDHTFQHVLHFLSYHPANFDEDDITTEVSLA